MWQLRLHAWNRLWKDGVMAALSYITGTHTLKAGLTFQSGYNRNGSLGKNADLVQRYRGTGNLFVPGVWLPDSVSVALVRVSDDGFPQLAKRGWIPRFALWPEK